jgi:hypothetical protein
MRAPLHIALALLPAVCAVAQDKPTQLDPKAAAKLQQIQQAKDQAAAKGIKDVQPSVRELPIPDSLKPEDRGLTSEQLRAKYKENLGAAYASYRATCNPVSIAPGTSGTLVLMMLLKNDGVMLASGPTRIDIAPSQGKLALGTPKLRPAGPTRLATGFGGKVAYDDHIEFDIPVTVAADATSGDLPVDLSLTYELFKGQTAGWIDKFTDRVHVSVQVRAAEAAAKPVVASTPTSEPKAANVADAPVTAGADDPAKSKPEADVAAGSGLPWILAAGVAVLAIAFLLVRRRS